MHLLILIKGKELIKQKVTLRLWSTQLVVVCHCVYCFSNCKCVTVSLKVQQCHLTDYKHQIHIHTRGIRKQKKSVINIYATVCGFT